MREEHSCNLSKSLFLRISIFAILMIAFGFVIAKTSGDETKNYTYKIPETDVTFEMVYIPGGEFCMGSPEDEQGRESDEGPVHKVKVNPFWMGKYEVTWDEFEIYSLKRDAALSSPEIQAVTRPSPSFEPYDHGWGRGKRPVMGVSLYAAQKYCEWLSAVTGNEYRLPTEAEWEFACRAGSKSPYFFCETAEKLGEYALFKENSEEKTQIIGQKQPNPYGLHDIIGNVWEFCQDYYDEIYYETFEDVEAAADNPKGPADGLDPVIRGGSWNDPPSELRSASRKELPFEWWERDPQRPRSQWWLIDGQYVGFRVVRSVK